MHIIDRYPYPQVQAVICGHTHQEGGAQRNNVTYLSTPACSCQFAPKAAHFQLDTLMPGYRYFMLHEDHYTTKVVRLSRS